MSSPHCINTGKLLAVIAMLIEYLSLILEPLLNWLITHIDKQLIFQNVTQFHKCGEFMLL